MRRWLVFPLAAVLLAGVAGGTAVGSRSAESRWVVRDLGTLGGKTSEATAINDGGQVVGSADLKGGKSHAFMWQPGRMTDLGHLPPIKFQGHLVSYDESSASEINDSGQVVGVGYYSDGPNRPFVWQRGVMTDLDPHYAATDYVVHAISNQGVAVGEATGLSSGRCLGFIWQYGRLNWLKGPVPGWYTAASGVNEHGEVVGVGTRGGFACADQDWGSYDTSAVRWQNGQIALLGSGEATAINDNGLIVGDDTGDPVAWKNGRRIRLRIPRGFGSAYPELVNNRDEIAGYTFTDAYEDHGLVWRGGKVSDLGRLPGTANTDPSAINDSGQIIGHCYAGDSEDLSDNSLRAFVWQDGKLTGLNTLGGKASDALAINDQNQIVGWATTKTGARHAVLWTLKP